MQRQLQGLCDVRYMPFALEYWDVLRPSAPLLRKQQLDHQFRRQKALESAGADLSEAKRGAPGVF